MEFNCIILDKNPQCSYAVKYGRRDYGYGKSWRPVDLSTLMRAHSYMFPLRDRGTVYSGPICHDPAKIAEWSDWTNWSGCKPADNGKEFATVGSCEFGEQTRDRSRVKDNVVENDQQKIWCFGPMSYTLPCVHNLRIMEKDLFDWFSDDYDMGAVYYDFNPQFEGKWPVGGKFAHQ